MTQEQFDKFIKIKNSFKSYCQKLNEQYKTKLFLLTKNAAQKDTPQYSNETAIVYNTALDEITIDSQIKLIVIADNPGKDEQLLKNQKYLVGQAGKIATRFFNQNKELNIDFRKNAIILNKTPIHTAKTSHLKTIAKLDEQNILNLVEETQIYMAQITSELQKILNCEIWLVGYGELKHGGIFETYKKTLKSCYKDDKTLWEKVFVFQHFSMNRFSIDLKAFQQNHKELNLLEAIHQLGTLHKNEFF